MVKSFGLPLLHEDQHLRHLVLDVEYLLVVVRYFVFQETVTIGNLTQ
jgi:hypothetical protein